MFDNPAFIRDIVITLVTMILSLTVHEFAHAWVAFRFGDPTATEQGRNTLSPISHIDPIGTLLLPISLMLLHAPIFFGWARPVPYNPLRFRRDVSMKTAAMWVAAAGPLANLLFAVVLTIGFGLSYRLASVDLFRDITEIVRPLIGVNIGLFVFNLFPLPPLDGSKVLAGLLPHSAAVAYEQLMQRMGFLALMLLVGFGRPLLAVPMLFLSRAFFDGLLPLVAGL